VTPEPGFPAGGAPSVDPTRLAELMVRVARLLLLQGLICNRIEGILERLAATSGMPAEINATPTSVFLSLGEGQATLTRMVRANPQATDYDKLGALLELLERIERREVGLAAASEEVERISGWAPRYGVCLRLMASMVLSGSSALLLSMRWREIAMAILLGLCSGAVVLPKRIREGPREALPVLVASIAAFLVFSAYRAGVPVHPIPLLVAGLISFLPGLQMTAAMVELATGHWVAGSSRLVAGATRLLLLVLGAMTGEQLAAAVAPISRAVVESGGGVHWGWLVAPGLAGLAFSILRSGAARDSGWVVAICYLGIVTAFFATPILGATGGAFWGAFCVALASNALAHRTHRPALVTLGPAILLLVPGVLGFMSLSPALAGDMSETLWTLLQVCLISVSLSLGGLLASLVVAPPRQV
jgi:uncharacterized membrane protein YjjP (DUF1212 family)